MREARHETRQETLQDAFDRMPGVVAVVRQGGRVVLTTTDSDATVLGLAATGLLRDLEVVGVGLEEGLLTLTNTALTNTALATEGIYVRAYAAESAASGDAGLLISAVLMPLLSYLLFTDLHGLTGQDRTWPRRTRWSASPGTARSAPCSTAPLRVVVDRSIGWMRQLRLHTVVRRCASWSAKGLAAMVTAIVPVVALFVAAVLVNGVRLERVQWLAIGPLLWFGRVPSALLGLGMGYAGARAGVQPLERLLLTSGCRSSVGCGAGSTRSRTGSRQSAGGADPRGTRSCRGGSPSDGLAERRRPGYLAGWVSCSRPGRYVPGSPWSDDRRQAGC